MTESFNAWLGDMRCKPVLQMMEELRVKIMKRFVKRKAKGAGIKETITPYAVKKLNINIEKSRNSHPSVSSKFLSESLFSCFLHVQFSNYMCFVR